MVDFVTCLNIDRQASIRLVVGEDSVELDCHGTEIEMSAYSLDQLLCCAEQALPRLTTLGRLRTVGGHAASTWVLCDPEIPPDCSLLGDAVEMRWGPVVLTLDKAILPELIRQGREASADLARRQAGATDCNTAPASQRDESTKDKSAGHLGATA